MSVSDPPLLVSEARASEYCDSVKQHVRVFVGTAVVQRFVKRREGLRQFFCGYPHAT